MNRKIEEAEVAWEDLMEMFNQPNYIGEVRMLSVNPRSGIKMVYEFEEEAVDILEDDVEEIIFEMNVKNLYLSCRYSDLIRIGKRRYLMGDAVVYRLNSEDDYADMRPDEMMLATKELIRRMQRVRTGGFCFPVIDLNNDAMEGNGNEEK